MEDSFDPKTFNSEQLRADWADPMGRLLSTDECGCKHYELGNGLCWDHFSAIFEGFKLEVSDAR